MFTWSEMRSWLRRWAPVAGIILLAVIGRLVYLSQSHLAQAHKHIQAEEFDEAIWDYQWAIRHYVPGWPSCSKAVVELHELAKRWHTDGDQENYRKTLNRLRGSLYAIRSFYQPFADTLKIVEEELRENEEPEGQS